MDGISNQVVSRRCPVAIDTDAYDELFPVHYEHEPTLQELRQPIFEEWKRTREAAIPICSRTAPRNEREEPHACEICGRLTTNDRYCRAACSAVAQRKHPVVPECSVCGATKPDIRLQTCGSRECKGEAIRRGMAKKGGGPTKGPENN